MYRRKQATKPIKNIKWKQKKKIEYRKQIDNETAPWQLLTNIDELLWNGVYALRVSDDNGSSNLPFRLADDADVITALEGQPLVSLVSA
ncbi:MAG: hypothetical protein J6Q73_03495 [Bacteroidaceae bacterium]|nr:hypothetical protein [Bacteroidaceae bacterium]